MNVGDVGMAVPPPGAGVGGQARPGAGVGSLVPASCPGDVKASLCPRVCPQCPAGFGVSVGRLREWGQRLSGQRCRGRLAGEAARRSAALSEGHPAAAAFALSLSQFWLPCCGSGSPGGFWNLAPILSIWNADALPKRPPATAGWEGLCAVPRLPGGGRACHHLGNSKQPFCQGD